MVHPERTRAKEYIRVQICYGERKERLEAEKILNKKIGGKERSGYLLEYGDGFRAWMPESRFSKTFRTVGEKGIGFGVALLYCQQGGKIRRDSFSPGKKYITINNTGFILHWQDGKTEPWRPKVQDILANDWNREE